jgi:hypothetical protein
MGTILVGMATLQQFQDALAAVQKGPLAAAALDRLTVLQQGFVGEPNFIATAVAIAHQRSFLSQRGPSWQRSSDGRRSIALTIPISRQKSMPG